MALNFSSAYDRPHQRAGICCLHVQALMNVFVSVSAAQNHVHYVVTQHLIGGLIAFPVSLPTFVVVFQGCMLDFVP
jgi:hypothetical protein